MSKEIIINEVNDNVNNVGGKVAIDKYDDTKFQKSIKAFFEKHKTAELRRIESTAKASELFDIDIAIKLPKEVEGEHAQKIRESSSALVQELKQEFYNYLVKEGFKIQSMSVRGVRNNGDEIETTISLILANVPKVNREHTERVLKLIENTLIEVSTQRNKKAS